MASDEPRVRQRARGNNVQVGAGVSNSVINSGGGVSIAIYQTQPAPHEPDHQHTLGELIEDILALTSKEQKSFAKFARVNFGETALEEVDALALRRLQAYAAAIVGRRA